MWLERRLRRPEEGVLLWSFCASATGSLDIEILSVVLDAMHMGGVRA